MTSTKHPSILWAQRVNQIFLTIEDGNLKINELVCEEDKFKIVGEKGGEKYEADLVLYGKLKGAERKKVDTSRRFIFFIKIWGNFEGSFIPREVVFGFSILLKVCKFCPQVYTGLKDKTCGSLGEG